MPLLFSIIYVAVIGILSYFAGEAIPRKRIDPYAFPFVAFSWERNGDVYNKIKIKRWKTKLPDMSKITKRMIPKSVRATSGSSDVEAVIKETCIAELVHTGLCFAAPVIFLFWIKKSKVIGVFLTLLYIFCNLPFILIQRYNRPHLKRLYEKLCKKEGRT